MDDRLRYQRDFASHVLKACFTKGLSPAFFLAGFVEETAELIEAMDVKGNNIEEWKLKVLSELGDVLWYTHAIIEHLPGGKMSRNCNDPKKIALEILVENETKTQPLLLIGRVAGAVKKHLRGDKDWPIMRERIQTALNVSVSSLVALTASCINRDFGQVLKEAMNSNIIKVEARLRLNTIRGDGARETTEDVKKQHEILE